MKSSTLRLLVLAALFQAGLHVTRAQPVKVFVRDVVVNNVKQALNASDPWNDTELSIAVNPKNTGEIVVTGFAERWSDDGTADAPLWRSTDGGVTWQKHFSIPKPDGRLDMNGDSIHWGSPADQVIDFDHNNALFGAFLSGDDNIYGGGTTDPSDVGSWKWDLNGPNARVVNINSLAPKKVDQPWLFITRNKDDAAQDDLYVAYFDQKPTVLGERNLNVSVARNTKIIPPAMFVPPTFTVDKISGIAKTRKHQNAAGIDIGDDVVTHPAQRLAADPRNGWVYSLYKGYNPALGLRLGGFVSANYWLNRTRDGGDNWGYLKNDGTGGATGFVVATADVSTRSMQFGCKRLLGGAFSKGIDFEPDNIHGAVDPANGEFYYLYGSRELTPIPVPGGGFVNFPWFFTEQLVMQRITADAADPTKAVVDPANKRLVAPGFFNGLPNGLPRPGIPSVAVATDPFTDPPTKKSVVGVFYYTHDGFKTEKFGDPGQPKVNTELPVLTAHLAISRDAGQNFTDNPLLTFTSARPPEEYLDEKGQKKIRRIIGDYMQLKAVGRTFYGAFTGNGTPLGRRWDKDLTRPNHDPIFFRFSVGGPALLVEKVPDFGEVGGAVKWSKLVLHNTGDEDLFVVDISRAPGAAGGDPRIALFNDPLHPLPAPGVPLVIPPGESRFVRVRVRPTVFTPPAGATATFNITSNDPDDVAAGVPRPVTYTYINSPPVIGAVPNPLAFGLVPPGPNQLNLTINNTGPAPLRVTGIDSTSAEYTPLPARPRFTIAAGGSVVVPVRFTPTGPGIRPAGVIRIFSNDPNPARKPLRVLVGGNTAPAPPPPPGGLPPIIAANGTVEYGFSRLAGINLDGPIFGSTFWTPSGQVLLGAGGGLQNLGLPALDVFRWVSPTLPLRTLWFGPRPFGAGATTIAALPGGGIVFPPPTFVQDFNLDGIASVAVNRGAGLFANPVPGGLFPGGLAIGARGFIPFGAQGAVAAACRINGNPFLVPPLVIAVGSPGPFQFTGYTLPPAQFLIRPPGFQLTFAQQPQFVLGNVGGVPGYFFNAWVVTTVPLLLGPIFSVDTTYTLISDPGMELDLDDSLLPPDFLPTVGGQVVSSNAIASALVSLSIKRDTGNRVRISWPLLQGANLEETPSLRPPAWQPVNSVATVSNGLASVTVTNSKASRFYRLASTPDSLALFRADFINGDYAVTGAGFQAGGVFTTNGPMASRTLLVTNVPSGAEIIAAYLYWATFSGGPSGFFNGNQILGTDLGSGPVACSTLGPVTVYRADVSSFVPTNGGNAVFNVGLPDSGSASVTPSALGASLVLVYQRNDLPPKSVSIYDGISVLDATNKMFFLHMQNFGQVAPGAAAQLTHIVGNGGVSPGDNLFFNGSPVGVPNNAFSGAQGARWDNPTLGVSALVHSGDSAATTLAQLASPAECLVWGAVVYSVSTPTNNQQRLSSTNLFVLASAGEHGAVSPNTLLYKQPGESQSFTAMPDANFEVDQWLADGSVAQTGGTTFALTNLQADQFVFVSFRPLNTVADLFVDIQTDVGAATVADDLTYSIVVSNAGPAQATSVSVNDPLPGGVILISATSSQGVCTTNSGSVQCYLGTLPAGSNATITIVVTPTGEGTISNSVSVSANEPDIDLSNNSAASVVDTLAPPAITLQPVSQNATNGDAITFTALATGSAPLSYQWYVADVIPLAGATNTSLVISNVSPEDVGDYSVVVSNSAGQVISDSATLTIVPSYLITGGAGTNGTINPSGTVTNFEGETRTFTATPNDGFVVHTWLLDGDVVQLGGTGFGVTNINSDHTVTVTFRGGGPQADVVVRSYAFASEAEKEEDAAVTLGIGELVEFRIEATNVGPDDSTGVQIHFNLPSGFQFVSADQPAYDSGTGIWNLGALGGIGNTAALVITAEATVAGDYTASAQMQTAGQPDPVASNDSGAVRVIVEP